MLSDLYKLIQKDYINYFLSFIGICISLYLTYTKLTSNPLVCGIGNCSVVQNSEYALLFGIPVAVFGVLYYLSLIFLVKYKQKLLLNIAIAWGLLFSAYLTYIELFVIYEICGWCVVSALIVVTLALNTYLRPNKIPAQTNHLGVNEK